MGAVASAEIVAPAEILLPRSTFSYLASVLSPTPSGSPPGFSTPKWVAGAGGCRSAATGIEGEGFRVRDFGF